MKTDCGQKALRAKHLTAEREDREGERRKGGKCKTDARLEESKDRVEEWVGQWGCYLGAGGWGGRESVNSWDIRCLDLASGGREDGLVTTDQVRKHKRERGRERTTEVWRGRRQQGEYQWPDRGTYGFLFRLFRA